MTSFYMKRNTGLMWIKLIAARVARPTNSLTVFIFESFNPFHATGHFLYYESIRKADLFYVLIGVKPVE